MLDDDNNNDNNDNDDEGDDWAKMQIESSSTFGGEIWGFFHGGLNYQIEHHLFPRYCHEYYPRIAKIVEKWCKQNNIHYTYFDNVSSNFTSVYKFLSQSTPNTY